MVGGGQRGLGLNQRSGQVPDVFCAACKMTGGKVILNLLYVGETLQVEVDHL